MECSGNDPHTFEVSWIALDAAWREAEAGDGVEYTCDARLIVGCAGCDAGSPADTALLDSATLPFGVASARDASAEFASIGSSNNSGFVVGL